MSVTIQKDTEIGQSGFFSPLATNRVFRLIWCLPICSDNYGFSESELVC